MKIIKKDVEMLAEAYSNICNKSNRRGKRGVVEEMLPALVPIAGAIGRGILAGAASGAVSNMMDDDDEEAEDFRDEKENSEYRDGKDDHYRDFYYNLKDYLDKFARDLEKDYHYFTSNDAPGHSEAADLVNSVIDTIDDYNEQAQGDGSREEFVELKDKVEEFLRDLNHSYEDFGSVAQNVIDGIIDDLNSELETY
jgi:hypothetical protein